MVKVSHARCRQCGQARHRNARFNLCGRCWQQHKTQLQEEWRTLKARRAAKRLGNGVVVTHEEATHAVVQQEEEIKVPRGRPNPLSPEQEAEIVALYTTTDQPVGEIARAYGVSDTTPFRVLDKAGVSWRRGVSGPKRQLPPHIEAMKEVHVAPTPAPRSVPSIEGLPVPVREDADLPEWDTPGTPVHPNLDTRSEEPLRKWRVEFSGFREVMAANAREAIAAAEAQGALDVTLVRLA